ncbi:S-adenosyl-L-methionine-dependent methyltransferase [Arabidopsis thaliana x Arabidopsis arenosa]|uniref:S-adenosyl-L-methionine-dependent methyltransferase n=1 Tax=Arabidopsis thaliana x Arabidopsis arenosa TaxID=1240361 RepID=A0A8T1XID4_9BRAS|nr:S-adenosyl-L-methionine-dependent methyltransferase [Arabidopsis thaliana x Arabidopsis arenosa]
MSSKGDNVAVCNMKLERLLSMKGGKGQDSYANNSQAQAMHARSMLHLLEETLDNVHLNSSASPPPFTAVDLGCSSGANTVHIIDFIVKHISKRFDVAGIDPPEFTAFFSDLPSNDFNTLFQLLPPLVSNSCMEECLAADGNCSYFVAGVPGSFYRRLFPARTIDFFHSAFSLHWLSQGLVAAEKRDGFNIPVYAPSLQDFKEVVEANGSFAIEKLVVYKGGSPLVVSEPDDASEVGRAFASSCRSVAGVLVEAHIGEELSNELFSRVERRATSHAKDVLVNLQFFHIVASLSFT